MLKIGIFLIVVIATLVPSQHGLPLQSKDIEGILELLKSQIAQDSKKQEIESSESDSSSDEDSNNNSIVGLLKNMEVIDLIHNANQDKDTSKPRHKSEREKSNHKHSHNHNPVYRNNELNRHKVNRDKGSEILEKLLHQNSVLLKKEKPRRLKPNNLLGIKLDDDDNEQEQTDALNEYSKIFVILDPLAVQKSQNKDALKNLVSRILSLSSSSNGKAHQERDKSHLYKGFKVKNNIFSRRYRGDSREGARDSMEDDFKQKRSRNDRGGGGGNGGRTAIPYIRQRGDIYEREH